MLPEVPGATSVDSVNKEVAIERDVLKKLKTAGTNVNARAITPVKSKLEIAREKTNAFMDTLNIDGGSPTHMLDTQLGTQTAVWRDEGAAPDDVLMEPVGAQGEDVRPFSSD